MLDFVIVILILLIFYLLTDLTDCEYLIVCVMTLLVFNNRPCNIKNIYNEGYVESDLYYGGEDTDLKSVSSNDNTIFGKLKILEEVKDDYNFMIPPTKSNITEQYDMNTIYKIFIKYINKNVSDNEDFDILILPLNEVIINFDLTNLTLTAEIKSNVITKLRQEFDKYKNTNIDYISYEEKLKSLDNNKKLFVFGGKNINFYTPRLTYSKKIDEYEPKYKNVLEMFNNITRLRKNVYYMLHKNYRYYFIFEGDVFCSFETDDMFIQTTKIDKIYTLNLSNQYEKPKIQSMYNYDEFTLNPDEAKKYVFDETEQAKYGIYKYQVMLPQKESKSTNYPNMTNYEANMGTLYGKGIWNPNIDKNDRKEIAEINYRDNIYKLLSNEYDRYKRNHYKPQIQPQLQPLLPQNESTPNKKERSSCLIM